VNIGETYDFLVQTPDTVERVATLELRASDGSLVGSQVIKFRHR
jgi:hypothetical protein